MTLTDGSILRRIGLQLQRDECGVATPRTSQRERPYHSKDAAARASLPFEGRRSAIVPTDSLFLGSQGNPGVDAPSLQVIGPADAPQGGCLPTAGCTPLPAEDVAARAVLAHGQCDDVAARAPLPFEGRRSASVPTAACAWCDAEAGIKPHPGMQQSHGICERHLAKIKAQLAELRQAAA
jgi:hypothetical protein